MPRRLGRLAGTLAAAAATAANGAVVDSTAVSLRRPPQQPPGADGPAPTTETRPPLLRLSARRSARLGQQRRPTKGRGRASKTRARANESDAGAEGAARSADEHEDDEDIIDPNETVGWPHRQHRQAYEAAEKRPVFFGIVCGWIALGGLVLMQSVVLWREYYHASSHLRAHGEKPTWSFVGYIRYRFGWWFTWNPSAYTFVVGQILVFFVMLFASLYCYYEGVNATTSMYKVLIWLMCPDGGVTERSTHGHIIGAVVSLGGLMIFAFAISMVHAGFSNYLDLIRTGYAPVVEGEHIVILGYTDETIVLVEELCAGFCDKGATKIAILAEGEKSSVEANIRARMHRRTYQSNNIVVRSGCSVDANALQHVSVATAAVVIVMPNYNVEKEQRDALTLQTLFLLRRKGWPLQGKVLAACSIARNAQLLERAGGSHTHLVMLNSFVAKLMSHCGLDHGLGMAINELVGFDGNAFFTEVVPEHLVGLPFSEAVAYYSDAVVVGMISPSTCPEAPPSQRRTSWASSLDNGDVLGAHATCDDSSDVCLCPVDCQLQVGAELLLVARKRLSAHASPAPAPSARSRQTATVTALCGYDEVGPMADDVGSLPQTDDQVCQITEHGHTIIILGWNEWTATVLIELDRILPPCSQAIVFDRKEVGSRNETMRTAQRNWKRSLQNIEVKNVEGQLGSYWQLEEKLTAPLEAGRRPPLEEAKTVFVLARQDTTPEKADAYAVTTILHIRDIMRKHGLHNPDVSFVPQISGSRTHPVCKGAGISDYVSTSDLMAKVLAVHAVDTRIGSLLDILVSGTQAEIGIRKLEDYLGAQAVPESVSFFDAARLTGLRGDVLLGWTEEHPGSSCGGRFVLNPLDKGSPRPWTRGGERLMVLHRRQRPAQAGPQIAEDHG